LQVLSIWSEIAVWVFAMQRRSCGC